MAIRLGLVVALVGAIGLTGRGHAADVPAPAGPQWSAAETAPLRSTETEAVAVARTTGRAVEVGAWRGEQREVWANPDGTFTEHTFVRPVRTVKGGAWVPVDPTLVRRPDGSVTAKAATVGLRLSGGGDGPVATMERAGRVMSLSWPWPEPLPAPTLAGDTATYREIRPGVDLVVHVAVDGLSHVLVVKDRQAAVGIAETGVAWGLHARGLTVRDAGEGRLAAVDAATGGRVFEAPEPAMWDSGDPAAAPAVDGDEPASKVAPPSARTARLGVRVAGGRLHLTPDRALLTDPATRFPVYLDPVWSATKTSFWAMVDSGFPDQEYPRFDGPYQNRTEERAGYCPPDAACRGSKVKRLFYNLPANYVGRTILSATFQVTMVGGWNTTARNISLYRMPAGVNSATNWNNQPGGGSWASAVHQQTKALSAQQACSVGTRNVSFTATEAVRWAAAARSTWLTFGLKAQNESNNQHHKRFCENAVLSVNWNRAPAQPATSALSMSPGGACAYGAAAPYVDTPPRLSAVLRDPDHMVGGDAEDLAAQFQVAWTPPGGTPQTVTWTSSMKASGSRFDYAVPAAIPQNVMISWQVRAWDGLAWGPWSADGTPTMCQFVYDRAIPAAPLVGSPEYLSSALENCRLDPDETPRDGVGRYGSFTFDSEATDVVEYRYGFNTNPSPTNVLRPSADGGPVSLRWLAEEEGPNFVTVQAVDRASKASATARCDFRVAAGRPAAGEWGLADDAAASQAADARGRHPAAAGPGVTFAVDGPTGPADKAARLSGSADGYLATSSAGLVDTAGGFAVSAWVRPTDLGRDMVAVSQDGSSRAGFTLGYAAGARKWSFAVPAADDNSAGIWQVNAGTPTAGEWAHLVAVYDAERRTIALHVNGQPPVTAARPSAWTARGAVQIGRALGGSGYVNHFAGDLAEVAVFDRVLVAAEIAQLSTLPPVRKGYWPFNTADGGVSPEARGGTGMSLAGGAVVMPEDPAGDPPYRPMLGSGDLSLTGSGAYAAAPSGVDTSGSFSVVARVRVASEEPGPPMAVLSKQGTHTSAFVVRRNAENRWEIALPHADQAGAAVSTAVDQDVEPTSAVHGQLLALVYNDFTNQALLFVDGELAGTATVAHTAAWNATGPLQVGQAFIDGGQREFFSGAIDDVRIYRGVLDQTTLEALNLLVERPEL